MLRKSGWLSVALATLGCLGGTQAGPVTPADELRQAKAGAASQHFPEARASAVAFWVAECKYGIKSPSACASAQLIRGEAELQTGAPETALLAFNWVQKNGDPASFEQADQASARAKAALQKLLAAQTDSSFLVVEQDFEDNHKFGSERALYTLDGAPIGEVTRRSTFGDRQHRVLAKPISSGIHQLAVEIHWKGEGTFDNYLWSSFNPVEIDAPTGRAVVASLDVSYTDGGPSAHSVRQSFSASKLP